MSNELKVAIEAAKKGAKVALSYFKKQVPYTTKSDTSLVTEADCKTEETIISYISSQLSNAKFIAEESGGAIKGGDLWIIDPIDGTRNFTRNIPFWSILIALAKNKEIILGLCYFPILDMMFYAEKGSGAYENERRVYASSINQLNKAYVGFGNPKYFKNKRVIMDLIERSANAKYLGSSLTHCLIAKGSIDGMVDAYGKVWDLAPFKVIIEEAGGKITRMNGESWTLGGSGCVITNGLIHEEILEIVNKSD